MGQKTTYFCDNCKKETNKTDLLKEKIPFIKELWATCGIGYKNALYLGRELKFEELELCPTCHKKYKQIWTDAMVKLANEWIEINKISEQKDSIL